MSDHPSHCTCGTCLVTAYAWSCDRGTRAAARDRRDGLVLFAEPASVTVAVTAGARS